MTLTRAAQDRTQHPDRDPVAHLHRVLDEITRVLDLAPHDLPVVSIRRGHVYIETAPDHLPALLEALQMADARPQPHPIASGETYVVVPVVADAEYDGQPWRVCSYTPMTHEDYRRLVADSVRDRTAT